MGLASRALTGTDWLLAGEGYLLPGATTLELLRRFRNPRIERIHPAHVFREGKYGPDHWKPSAHLAWSLQACSAAGNHDSPTRPAVEVTLDPSMRILPSEVGGVGIASTWVLGSAPEPAKGLFGAEHRTACPAWKRVRPVTMVRYGGERDEIVLIQCDGSITSDALERVSAMARPVGTERPPLPLPDEPDPVAATRGEWVDGVKVLHPRLLWALQQVADAYPWRIVYVISGYRSDSGSSLHKQGRAIDFFVMGVPNDELFALCQELPDVGCGYYPNNRFVHMDVRPLGTGHPIWIDAAPPGEPSHYVDAWPGVVQSGALQWAGAH